MRRGVIRQPKHLRGYVRCPDCSGTGRRASKKHLSLMCSTCRAIGMVRK